MNIKPGQVWELLDRDVCLVVKEWDDSQRVWGERSWDVMVLEFGCITEVFRIGEEPGNALYSEPEEWTE